MRIKSGICVVLVAIMLMAFAQASSYRTNGSLTVMDCIQNDASLTLKVKLSDASKAINDNPKNFLLNASLDDGTVETKEAYTTQNADDLGITYYYTILYQANMLNDSNANMKAKVRPAIQAFSSLLDGDSFYRFIVYDANGIVKTTNPTTGNSYLTGFSRAGDWDELTVTQYHNQSSTDNPLLGAFSDAVSDCLQRTSRSSNVCHVVIAVAASGSGSDNNLVNRCRQNNVMLYLINVGGSGGCNACDETGGKSISNGSLSSLSTSLTAVKSDVENILYVSFKPSYKVMTSSFANLQLQYGQAKSAEISIRGFEVCSTTPEPTATPTPKPSNVFFRMPDNNQELTAVYQSINVYKTYDTSSEIVGIIMAGESWEISGVTDEKDHSEWVEVKRKGTLGYAKKNDGVIILPTPTPSPTPTPTPTPSPTPLNTPTPTLSPTPSLVPTVPPKPTETVTAGFSGAIETNRPSSHPTPEPSTKTGIIAGLYKNLESKFGDDTKWLLAAAGLLLVAIIAIVITLIVSGKKHRKRIPSHSSSDGSLSESVLGEATAPIVHGEAEAGETQYQRAGYGGAEGTGYEATSASFGATEYDNKEVGGGTIDPFFSAANAVPVSSGNDDSEKTYSDKLSHIDPDATVREDKRGLMLTLHWELDGKTKDYTVRLINRIILGRKQDCDVTIDDKSVSRKHATISLEPDGMFIVDEGSTYGTQVNGAKISDKTAIKNGDELMLGDSKLTLNIQE